MSSPVSLREFNRQSDLSFVKSSFLKSYRNSRFTVRVPNDIYYGIYSPLIEELIESANTRVLLAVNPDDSQQIYSWVIWEKLGNTQILHYVYTKLSYRTFGIARKLLEGSGFNLEQPFFYTLGSRAVEPSTIWIDDKAVKVEGLAKHFPNAVHNPFLLLGPSRPANDNK